MLSYSSLWRDEGRVNPCSNHIKQVFKFAQYKHKICLSNMLK